MIQLNKESHSVDQLFNVTSERGQEILDLLHKTTIEMGKWTVTELLTKMQPSIRDNQEMGLLIYLVAHSAGKEAGKRHDWEGLGKILEAVTGSKPSQP